MSRKETPILFTAKLLPMTIDGRKVETRRVPRKLPKWATPDSMHVDNGRLYAMEDGVRREIPCPYGKAGDLLLQSTACVASPGGEPLRRSGGDLLHCGEPLIRIDMGGLSGFVHAIYERDGAPVRDADGFIVPWRWKVKKLASMYTPKAYRRIWFEVLETRAEHLKDITVAGMRREGLHLPDPVDPVEAVEAWRSLWDGINAKRGYPCASDPIVWAVRFKCVSTGRPE